MSSVPTRQQGSRSQARCWREASTPGLSESCCPHILSCRATHQVPLKVLLTRSGYLAEKLRVYTKRLIETRLMRTTSTDARPCDPSGVDDSHDELYSKTLGDLSEEDFPLVCTFGRFMKLLENTVRYAFETPHDHHGIIGSVTNRI